MFCNLFLFWRIVQWNKIDCKTNARANHRMRSLIGEKEGKTSTYSQDFNVFSWLSNNFQVEENPIPINVCFAMAINKAQGQSLTKVGIYLPTQVFSHGQLYVALSRGQNQDKIKVAIGNGFNRQKHRLSRNIYLKVFLSLIN